MDSPVLGVSSISGAKLSKGTFKRANSSWRYTELEANINFGMLINFYDRLNENCEGVYISPGYFDSMSTKRYDWHPMLLNKLPATLNPQKLCQTAPAEGLRLSGKIPLGNLPNLDAELKSQGATEVTVTVVFSMDSDGYCRVAGELEVDLVLICQRCMLPMDLPLRANFLVSPVVSDVQAQQLPARYEPLLVTNGEIVVTQWIAEELYLALPFVPRHDTDCVSHDTNKD
jgi:uncharacterized protein